jgi:hypothetical protein
MNNWQVADFIEEVNAEINEKVEELLETKFKKASAEDLGLDRRAFYGTMYVSEGAIVVEGPTKHLDYYGGFEYVDAEDRKTVGSYTFFMAGDADSEYPGRIRQHIGKVFPKVLEPWMEE